MKIYVLLHKPIKEMKQAQKFIKNKKNLIKYLSLHILACQNVCKSIYIQTKHLQIL